MPRYRLRVAYDGTNFCGWQRQTVPPAQLEARRERDAARSPVGVAAGYVPKRAPLLDPLSDADPPELRTVQAVVERAVRQAVREPVNILGASRTDAGVHARSQCAVFDASSGAERGVGWPAERGPEPLRHAINARLPDDVRIVEADLAPDGFDPIAGAQSKGYAYTLVTSRDRPVFSRRYAAHVRHQLDMQKMNEAAAMLVGEHDFAAFAAAGHGRATTVRTVFACRVLEVDDHERPAEDGRLLRIEVSGNGFLWNMVRIIAGTLVEVGRGAIDLDRLRLALTEPDRALAGPTMPPEGLCLEWIEYPDRRLG